MHRDELQKAAKNAEYKSQVKGNSLELSHLERLLNHKHCVYWSSLILFQGSIPTPFYKAA